MKHAILSIFCTVAFFFCDAQITLDHAYPSSWIYSGQVIIFNHAGEKILVNDSLGNATILYNPDYSIWKTISYPTIPGYNFISVYAVSDNLFNSDDLVEMMVTYSGSTGYISRIVNENGIIIQDLDGAYTGSVKKINGVLKFITYRQTNNSFRQDINIYSVPGTMPCAECSSLGVEKLNAANSSSASISTPVPNPSTGEVRLYYTLPYDISSAFINIVNATGQVIKTIPVFSKNQSIVFDNSNLSSGIYQCVLFGDGIEPKSTKMIK